jgi:hypothetical protein
VLIHGTVGEYVNRRTAVDHYGPEIFEAMNRLIIPRDVLAMYAKPVRHSGTAMNIGGMVDSSRGSSSAGSSAVGRSLVVSGEQEFDQLIKGGAPALMRFFSARRDEINAQLGRR